MSSEVIKIENLSKQYRLGVVGSGTLSHDLNRFWAKLRGKEDPLRKLGEINDRTAYGSSKYVWALKDINLSVQAGEVLGVIGGNGAGKSTLLKIMSQVTSPTTGSVKMNGRVGSLLEVGTGFHPELTGRENIFINGAILGMRKHEIIKRFDEIVCFAGVEKYIDTPVKRYSSGMKVRLAFAIAAHLESEILIVDEVLAVGDVEFQNKCLGKMDDISTNSGRTVLFVSHNVASIRRLCRKSVFLANGQVTHYGSIEKSLSLYLGEENYTPNDSGIFKMKEADSPASFFRFELVNSQNTFSSQFSYHEDISVNIYFKVEDLDSYAYLSILIRDSLGNHLCIFTDEDKEMSDLERLKNGKYVKSLTIPSGIFKPGSYTLCPSIFSNDLGVLDTRYGEIKFEVVDTSTFRGVRDKYRKGCMVAPLGDWSEVKVEE